MSTTNDPMFEKRLATLMGGVLDAEAGPHPAWTDSPAARRVAAGEGKVRRFPPLRMLALAAVLVVGGAVAAVGASRLLEQTPKPVPTLPIAVVAPTPRPTSEATSEATPQPTPAGPTNGWIAYETEGGVEIIKPGEAQIPIRGIGSDNPCPQFGNDGLLAMADRPPQPNEFRWDVTSIRLPNERQGPTSEFEILDSIDVNQRALDAGQCFEWSPDGERVAFNTLLGTDVSLTIVSDDLNLMPVGASRDHLPAVPDSVAWNADGSLLAAVHGVDPDGTGVNAYSILYLLPPDASEGARAVLETEPGEVINQVAFSPLDDQIAIRGTKLAQTGNPKDPTPVGAFIRVVTIHPDGAESWMLDDINDVDIPLAAGPTWSPDGRQLAWVLQGELRIGRPGDGEVGVFRRVQPVSSDEMGTGWATDPVIWSTDGRHMLSGQLDQPFVDSGVSTSVVLYDLDRFGTVQPQTVLPWQQGGYGRVTWQVLGE